MDTTITTLEMCAGYGGIGLGIKNIFGERLRTIAYCELEGFAQANLISKMEKGLLDAAPIWSDLKTFPFTSFHGLVDILIAGYPCQPFSSAGKRSQRQSCGEFWESRQKQQSQRSDGNLATSRQTQPTLGGDVNGTASGMDYAELSVTSDNRTDELRLLGNGVVPATATRAFLTLMEELNK